MKKALSSGLLVTMISSIAYFALAETTQPATNLKDCIAMLPQGHVFNLELKGVIDTFEEQPEFKGEMNLSDGGFTDNPKLSAQLTPFRACVISLIK